MNYVFIPGEHEGKGAPPRYQLAVVAAQRARQLVEGDKPTSESRLTKPTTIAIEEILGGQLKLFYGQEAIQYQEEAARTRRTLRHQSFFKERDEELRREIKKDLSIYLADGAPKDVDAKADSTEAESE